MILFYNARNNWIPSIVHDLMSFTTFWGVFDAGNILMNYFTSGLALDILTSLDVFCKCVL